MLTHSPSEEDWVSHGWDGVGWGEVRKVRIVLQVEDPPHGEKHEWRGSIALVRWIDLPSASLIAKILSSLSWDLSMVESLLLECLKTALFFSHTEVSSLVVFRSSTDVPQQIRWWEREGTVLNWGQGDPWPAFQPYLFCLYFFYLLGICIVLFWTKILSIVITGQMLV